ncbi:PAS domain-containing protein, partial [Oceanospirillum sp. HFRX-1_2]
MKNFEGDFLLCNESLARLYGSTPKEMVGKSDADFNPNKDQVAFYKQNIQQVMRSGKLQIVEEASTDADTGEVRYFQSIKKPLKGPDGRDRILVIAHDITELKHAHRLIEEKERRYAYAMAAAGEGIWDWDIPGKRVQHNRKWCDLLGLDSSHTSHDISVLSGLIHPEDHDAMMAALNQALAGDGIYSHEHRMVRASGDIFWGYDRGRVVEWDESGQPVRMVGSITDITDRKHAEQKLAVAKAELEKSNQ